MSDENVGHGHVFARPDGVRAKCGGPAVCDECLNDQAAKNSQPRRYRKKPVVIEAAHFDGSDGSGQMIMGSFETDERPIGWAVDKDGKPCGLLIYTLEGVMRANPGDYIIRGVKGEVYPCKPDVFKETYEAVADRRLCGLQLFFADGVTFEMCHDPHAPPHTTVWMVVVDGVTYSHPIASTHRLKRLLVSLTSEDAKAGLLNRHREQRKVTDG